MEAVPVIYARLGHAPLLASWERAVALAIAGGCLAVLVTAAWLHPDAHGMGTHTQLGLQPCGFLMRTGLPCAGCGMTTSFAYLVRGHVISSFIAQPFGLILCLLTAAGFWGGLYVAVTGRRAHKLLELIPMKAHVAIWPTLALSAWLWKIALVVWH